MESAAVITIDDLVDVLRAGRVSLGDVAPALGITEQALSYRLAHSEVSGLEATMIIDRATFMLEASPYAKEVSTMLGHARIGITFDIYGTPQTDLKRKVADALEQRFAEAAGG